MVFEMLNIFQFSSQWFTNIYAWMSIRELRTKLDSNIWKIYEMIDSMSDEDLFRLHRRKWADDATKATILEVYKFIHINIVALFGTFRTKIRKGKKLML